MGFAENLGSLVIKSHTTKQVKIASESLEIELILMRKKELLFLKLRKLVT